MFYKEIKSLSNLNIFLATAIFTLLYINTFSDSQHLIELAVNKLKDPSLLPYDLVINSYEFNPIVNLPLFFFYGYSLIFPFDEDFLLLNLIIKTFTIFGIYRIYGHFIANKLICFGASLIYLSPSIKILPYIADWYVVSPNLHTNSLFYLFFVYLIWGLINRKYYFVLVFQIFALLFHPLLGMFLALPVLLLFYFCYYFKSEERFLGQIEKRSRLILPSIFIIINVSYFLIMIGLNDSSLNPIELINIFFIHAPHHYYVSSFSFLQIAWPYLFMACSYWMLIRVKDDSVLRLFLLILGPFILLSVPVHFIFSEIFSKYLHFFLTSYEECL